MPDLRIGVCYDFRNPPDSGRSNARLYAEIMEQVRWLDRLGADLVWFTEHHFVEDGYLPSWTPVAGAMAAVTENVRFGTDICLMPFRDPIRLAEDLAILDNISDGRMELGAGMGYAGAADLDDLRHRTRLVRITGAGLRESHPHDVAVLRDE